MSLERLKLAIGRLEHALARAESHGDTIIQALEAQVLEVSPAAEMVSADENYKALEKKHDLLKQQAAQALSAIENLIPVKGQN